MKQKEDHRNIWVLGGTGFIGTSLVRHLSNDGGNQLNLLVNKTINYRSLEGFNTISGNLENFDYSWMERYPPETIFHLARISGSNRIGRLLAGYRGNRANKKMVQFLKGLEKPPAVVYVSGSLMYGNIKSGLAIETNNLKPEGFGRYYLKGEEPWLLAQKTDELDVRFARPGWIVGPTSWFKAFFWKRMKESKEIPIFGTGKQLMSLIHINDCAKLIDGLSKLGSRGQNLNIFGCKPITQEEFSETISSITGLPLVRWDFTKTKKMHGSTTAQALCSSTPMDTIYHEIYEELKIEFDSPKTILTNVLGLLENE